MGRMPIFAKMQAGKCTLRTYSTNHLVVCNLFTSTMVVMCNTNVHLLL